MSRRVLALPWIIGSLVFGCGSDQRDFGDRPQESDGGSKPSKKDDAGTDTDGVSVVVVDAGSGSSSEQTSSDVSAPSTSEDAGSTSSTTDGDTSVDDTGTTPAGPTLDGACSKGGVRACDVNDAKQTLVCSQGRWQSNGGCAKKDNCDPSVGACSEIVAGCTELVEGARYCQPGDELWECGPALVSETLVETCEGNCVVDGETSKCARPECGNGKTQTDEACDDGNDDNEDACTTLCKPPECGDGLTQSWEVCDDGNDDENDDCTTLCEPPVCGDGIQQLTEACDDGNADEDDSCTTTCKLVTCGEGVKQSWEACDDGNNIGGDGCSPTCAFDVVDVVSNYYHTCALNVNGRIKCWGWNTSGQLGVGTWSNMGGAPDQMGSFLPEVDVGTERSVLQVVTGYRHTCALLDNHHVKCWGGSDGGQLGQGDNIARGDEPNEMGDALPEVDLGTGVLVEELAAGFDHTCARLSDGQVKCWGRNSDGQLGYGDMDTRGDAAGEMGDQLSMVELGLGRTAQKIAASAANTCALLDNYELKCWGYNYYGQLGQGNNTTVGNIAGQMGDALPAIDLGSGRIAVNLDVGAHNVCATLDTGALKCWGNNGAGQLGLGSTDAWGDGAGEMGDSLPTIDLGYGRMAFGVATSDSNTCALLDTSEVKCWGFGYYGVPGQGSTETWGDASYEMGDALPIVPLGSGATVRKLTVGGYHACVVLADATVKCWGYNSEGELGHGNPDYRGNAPDQMGDALPVTALW